MNLYLDLFLTFAKVGVCTFGGGYAMLPILQREVVEKKGWVTEEEVTDYFAIGQCTPGIIAVNTSVFIGYRQRGVPGGIAAALGVVFPSFVVITIIAAFLTKFATYPVVQHALAGINAAVVALIAVSVLKLGKTNLRGRPAVCIFLGVLVLGELSGLLAVDPATPLGAVLDLLSNPAFLVVAAGATGWLLGRVKLIEKHPGDHIKLGGFDVELLRAVSRAVSVPVVASGGAGSAADFAALFRALPELSAGLAASIFHFGDVTIPALKRALAEEGVCVRL